MTDHPIVDSHQHFWRRDALEQQAWRSPAEHAALARDFEPADLTPDLAAVGVQKTVLIQSMDNAEENRRLASFAQQATFVAGIVAWLPLHDAAAAGAELDALDGLDTVRGVRCLVGRDRLDWLATRESTSILSALVQRRLAWDVVPVTEDQILAVEAVAQRLPELRIVIDHLARPPIDSDGWEPWAGHVRRLARHPNVVVKLSVGVDVLTAWKGWDGKALGRYVGHALECFGPARCLLASNWPVVLLRRDYAGAWRDMEAAVRGSGLDDGELAEVRGAAAQRIYRLADRTHGR